MSLLDSARASPFIQSLPSELGDDLLLDSLPVGVYACDAEGLIVRYNRAAAALWGRKPQPGEPGERFCGSYRLLDLGGTHIPSAKCPMAIALTTGQNFRDERIQIERPDGSRIVVLVTIRTLKNVRGEVTGAVNMFRDDGLPVREGVRTVDRAGELESVLQALPAAIYTTDLDGRITFFNEAAAELWGVRPELHRSEFCGSWKLYWPDGTALPHDQCPMAMALKEGRAVKGKEAVAERPDGTRVPFLAHPTPLFDKAGRMTGAVNMLVDISGRKEAALAVQRLAAIVESSDDAILSKDLKGIITSWNRGAEQLYGYPGEEVIGQPVAILIPEDRRDEEPKILARIRQGERIEHYETMRRCKDGSLVDISLSVSPIIDATGMIVGASKIARDITDRRRAEEQKDLLLREMDHRIKNLFALANGMVTLSGREAASVSDLVSDLQDRFGALARAHSLTMPNGSNRESEQVATLHALIYKVTEPYLCDQTEGRITVTGPDFPIGPATVTNFALLFHEFATNALKYGALAVAQGKVRIECRAEGDNICIDWREYDKPGGSGGPSEDGFGSRLARATIEGPFGGSFSREFKSDGLEIRLGLPRHRING
ncbi:PAS domain S-box protein [Sphingopyxis sp. JAI108]|uniref:PAS domain S-box protein n=1 Tax=Sphingopyxis sp. JAI108 TaxID=2723060 RepID=UPI0015C6BE0D|nr:PAS domain S-box protein [Sphingopyxis sp. JAI108]NYF33507.1 PAS domain S-box-containing protein [Sphingopyxis sp. JAI108]